MTKFNFGDLVSFDLGPQGALWTDPNDGEIRIVCGKHIGCIIGIPKNKNGAYILTVLLYPKCKIIKPCLTEEELTFVEAFHE